MPERSVENAVVGKVFPTMTPTTPPAQQEYIITEEQLGFILGGYGDYAEEVFKTANAIRSHPAHPAAPRFNSTDLLLLAHDEWKRRQERKHLDDEVAWVFGFIGGFITDKTWARDHLDNLRTPTQEHP